MRGFHHRRWAAAVLLGGLWISPAALAASSTSDATLQAERQDAFDRVILRYPVVGRTGLLDEARDCYGKAQTVEAVRACYLLDLTTRMIDAHVAIVRSGQSHATAGDLREAETAALDRARAIGSPIDPQDVVGWSLEAKSRVTPEQRQEVFAMLHQG
jgi:hypothetical protein